MQWQGVVLTLVFSVVLALYSIRNKKLILKKIPDECISVVNFLGAGVLLLGATFLFDPPHVVSWLEWPVGFLWAILPTAMLNIVIMYGNVKALKYGDVSLIGPIAVTQPLIVLVPSYIVLGEVPGSWGYSGLFLLAIGMYIFSFAEEVKGWIAPQWLQWMGNFSRYFAPWFALFSNKGVQIALVVAVCGAISINFDKLSAIRAQSFLFSPTLILLNIGAIGLWKTVRQHQWIQLSHEQIKKLWLGPILLALAIALGWYAFGYGLAAYAGALRRIVIIWDVLFAYFLLRETRALKRWPGAFLMGLGAACISLD